MTVLDESILFDVVLADNSDKYVYMFLKDTVFAILEGSDVLEVKDPERYAKLEELNEEIVSIDSDEFFSQSRYSQILDILCEEYKMDRLEMSLRFLLSIFKKVEYESRPPAYLHEYYESGI